MVLPGHIAGGYLITKALFSIAPPSLSPEEISILLFLGTISGEIPDIDLIFSLSTKYFKSKFLKFDHREHITHAPIFWFTLCLFMLFVGYVSDSTFVVWASVAIFLGTMSHFLLDSIEYGIRWLWPFTKRRYALIANPNANRPREPVTVFYYLNYIKTEYIVRFSFYAEIAITIIAIIVFLR
ncbi:MAG: metal-dependent hydrolase [Candidatus Paceibacterota bacterium]|jgi:membrane-bound metal-dependent hydrolase YbcI (DUF457 family)